MTKHQPKLKKKQLERLGEDLGGERVWAVGRVLQGKEKEINQTKRIRKNLTIKTQKIKPTKHKTIKETKQEKESFAGTIGGGNPVKEREGRGLSCCFDLCGCFFDQFAGPLSVWE